MRVDVGTDRARRFGSERLPEIAEPVGEFWRPADAPTPVRWIVLDGLRAAARARGVDFATALAILAAALGLQRKTILRGLWQGFHSPAVCGAFAEAVERLEGPHDAVSVAFVVKGTPMSRKRGDVLRRKAALLDEQRREKDAQMMAAAIEKMKEVQAHTPHLRVRPDGVFANAPWLQERFRLGSLAMERLPERVFGEPGKWFLMADVENLFDSGEAGIRLMGRLEIFRIYDLAEMNVWDRELLGVVTAGRVEPQQGGPLYRFESVPRPDWAVGAPSLEGCLPLEVGYDYGTARLIWVRRLPAGAPAETATGASPEATITGPAGPAGQGDVGDEAVGE